MPTLSQVYFWCNHFGPAGFFGRNLLDEIIVLWILAVGVKTWEKEWNPVGFPISAVCSITECWQHWKLANLHKNASMFLREYANCGGNLLQETRCYILLKRWTSPKSNMKGFCWFGLFLKDSFLKLFCHTLILSTTKAMFLYGSDNPPPNFLPTWCCFIIFIWITTFHWSVNQANYFSCSEGIWAWWDLKIKYKIYIMLFTKHPKVYVCGWQSPINIVNVGCLLKINACSEEFCSCETRMVTNI